MRRTRYALLAVPAAATLIAATLVAPIAHAATSPTTVLLPIGHADSVAAAGSHVLISQGKGRGDQVLVRNADGSDAGVISGLPGASGMVTSRDGSVVYVALADGDAIAVLDAATLTVTATLSTGVASCPRTVATENGRVYYGADCSTSNWQGVVGMVSPAGRASIPATFYDAPLVTASDLVSGAVFVGDPGNSPGSVWRYSLTPAGSYALTATATGPDNCSNIGDLTVAADGRRIVVACGAPYHHIFMSATTLAVLTSAQTTNPYPNSVATTADGVLAEGCDGVYSDVLLLDDAGAQVGAVTFPVTNESLIDHGLVWGTGGQTLFAVTDEWTGSLPTTDILRLEVMRTSIMRHTASTFTAPTGAVVDTPVHLTGSLRSAVGAVPLAGRSVNLIRAGLSVSVVTGPDGVWSYDDYPPVGTTNYEAYFAGDAVTMKADNLATVSVSTQGTSVSLAGPATIAAGTTLHLVGQLSVAAPGSAAGRAITISSGPVTAVVTTAADGSFAFDQPTVPAGSYSYRATYAGDAKTSSSSASVSGTAVAVPSALTLSAETQVTAPAPVHLTGTLTIGGVAAANRQVVLSRSGAVVATVTTGTDGSFWAEEAAPVGSNTYTASFAGDSVTAASSATWTVSVVRAVSTVSLSAPGTVTALTPVHLTGTVTIPYAYPGGRPVTISRSGAIVATVTTAADGSFTFDDWAVAGSYTYVAAYAGDASTTGSSASQNVTVTLAASTMSVSTSVTAVNHRTTITVTAHLVGGRTNRSVTIYAKTGGGARVAIGWGVVNASGNYALAYTVTTTTAFSADYTGDATYSGSTSAIATVTYK